jgi:hypothetical protein
MTISGAPLGADLYDLRRAGRDYLPAVAAEYVKANAFIAETAGMTGAFHRSEQFGGAEGPVSAVWRSLRDELQTILADTSVNLKLTGDALCMAAAEYARTDEEAAAELNRQITANGDPPPVVVTSPRYP